MTDASEGLQRPTWNGTGDASIDAVLCAIRERFGHNERLVEQYENALRGNLPRIPRTILAETTVLYFRHGRIEHGLSTARKFGWGSAWDFPELVDWMEGDPEERREELLAAIGGIERLICGEGFTLGRREYVVVYAHIESVGDAPHVFGFAACPSIYIA